MPLSVNGSEEEGERQLQQSRRGRGSNGGNESPVEEDDDLDPTIEVIHILSTKTSIGTKSATAARLSYSPDGSREQTDAQHQQQQQQQQHQQQQHQQQQHQQHQPETEDTKDKTNKWKKLKTGLSRSTKLIGRRLKRGGGRSEKNVVHEICILPSNGLNGECFGEEEKDDEKEKEDEEEGGRKAKGGRKGRKGGKGKGGKGIGGIGRHQRSDSDDSLVFASRSDSATSSRHIPPSVESNKKTIDESIVIYDADYDGQL